MSDDPSGRVAAAFARTVPEVASGIVVIRAIARDPGVRTKVAVDSDDPLVDLLAPFAGRRLREISAALGGEGVHVTTWSSFPDVMIRHALAPLRVTRVELDEPSHRARVAIPPNQLRPDLAWYPGYLELASRLAGWKIDFVVDPDA